VEQVSFENSNDVLSLGLGRARAKLALLPIKNNPWHFPEKVPEDTWCIKLTDDILKALEDVLIVKASQPTRAEHHGVIFYPTKKGVYLFTTDDISLARAFIKGKLPDNKPLLIPRQFLTEVTRQCSEGAELLLLGDCVMVREDDLRICSHLLEATDVLNLDELIAPYVKGVTSVPIPEGLPEALKRALIMARGDKPIVKLTSDKGELTLSANYPTGEFTETLAVADECVGEVLVRADLLVKLLPNVDTMAISEKDALVLQGGDALTYVVSGAGE
jgi:DNA polymerase III sliding clamp (beta) subunit (PCNA family)